MDHAQARDAEAGAFGAAGAATPHAGVPILDLGLMLEAPSPANAAPQRKALDRLAEACADCGTFSVVNHGLPGDVIDSLLSLADEFFALPMAEKARVSRGDSASARGFRHQSLPAGLSHDSFLWIEAPEHLRQLPGLDSSLNLWPERPARFETVFRASARALSQLSRRVLQAIGLSAGLGEDALAFLNELQSIQLHDYDPGAELPAHTDMAPLTIIFADADGLEVKLSSGSWAPVPSTGGVLSCMLGDVAMRLTNDCYQTALHRVARQSRRRRSVLWEPGCDPHAPIGPLSSFCSGSESPRYEKQSFAEIVRQWLAAKQD